MEDKKMRVLDKSFSIIIPSIIFSLFGAGIFLPIFFFLKESYFSVIWGLPFISFGLFGFSLCFKRIPADPPHIGVVTIWGKRLDIRKEEGWRFLAPFFPFFYDIILINVEKKDKDFGAINIRTPDMAPLLIPVSLTWGPDPENPINYLNSGGEAGVEKILHTVIIERIRGWAMDETEGPQTFDQAIAAREEVTGILIKAIAGEELNEIPSIIPTPILTRYFKLPQPKPQKHQKEFAGKNWENVEKILQNENIDEIRQSIKERDEKIAKIRNGSGYQKIIALGMIVFRFNIGDINIQPGSQLFRAVEDKIKEEQEQKGDIIEINNLAARVKSLTEEPHNFSIEKAIDVVQTERGKVAKKIIDIQGFEGINEIIKTLKGS